MVDFIQMVYKQYPSIKHDLYMAHMQITPQNFIKRSLTSSVMYGFATTLLVFFLGLRTEFPFPLVFLASVLAFPMIAFFIFHLQFNIPKGAIRKRAVNIDNEILFAARFLLVKLSSGRPLFNALIDTSQSYGVAAKYFKEITDDINLGTPIELALRKAMDNSPSKNYRKLLFQIVNALKIGVDVTTNLSVVIEEIEHEQIMEIERYSKKLSSVALFYMLGAIVIPSLGMTLFTVLGSFLSIEVGILIYGVVLAVLIGIQLFFLSIFRQIRPSVNV